MILLLKKGLSAILKKVLMIFILQIENVKRAILEEFENDTILIKMMYYKNVKINMHVLKTWMID